MNTQRYNIKDLIKSKERRAWMQMDDHNRCETVRGLMRDHMGKLMSMKSMEGLEKVELKEITSGKHHKNFSYHSLSTNAHENLNKTVKELLGLRYLNQPRLLQKMHLVKSSSRLMRNGLIRTCNIKNVLRMP